MIKAINFLLGMCCVATTSAMAQTLEPGAQARKDSLSAQRSMHGPSSGVGIYVFDSLFTMRDRDAAKLSKTFSVETIVTHRNDTTFYYISTGRTAVKNGLIMKRGDRMVRTESCRPRKFVRALNAKQLESRFGVKNSEGGFEICCGCR